MGIPIRTPPYVSSSNDHSPHNNSSHSQTGSLVTSESESQVRVLESRPKPQCWDHGCNGREFSTFSNLLRHQRERSGAAAKSECPHCGAVFTRSTARNTHIAMSVPLAGFVIAYSFPIYLNLCKRQELDAFTEVRTGIDAPAAEGVSATEGFNGKDLEAGRIEEVKR